MRKVAYVINRYKKSDEEEKTIAIVCYLYDEGKEDGNFAWKFDFERINNENTDVKKALDNLFMSLRELQLNGYELKFMCEGVEEC